jgi:hypothetical protein
MINIINSIKEYSEIIDGITITIRDKRKSYDFRQLAYDLVMSSMVGLTLKALVALSTGQTYINLY